MPVYPDATAMFAAHGITAPEIVFEHEGYSGAHMTRIDQHGQLFVVKRVRRTEDWIIQMTSDHALREAQIAASGVLADVAPGLRSPSIAAARDGDGFALLMHDVTPHLLPGDAMLPAEVFELILARVAQLHARFWDAPPAIDIGWCGLRERLLMLSEQAGDRLRDAGLMEFGFATGWERFHNAAGPEASRLVRRLHDDPAPLIDVLGALPQTLVHNDIKTGNLAVEGETVWLFDWALSGHGPVACELGWLLAVNSSRLPWSLDETTDRYRACVERELGVRFPEREWEQQRAAAHLCGVVMLGWGKWADPVELAWWCQRALEAKSLLRL